MTLFHCGFRPVRRLPLVLALLVLAGCAGVTPIRDLLDDPSRYDGKTVRIEGKVRGAAGGLGVGAYEVEDETGRLTVVTDDRDPPRSGANVGVKGKFQALLSLGIKSLAVLREEDRFDP
ncbi:MAG TPA: hypothetical protein VHG52_02900 [Thermomicrobiales bacterium]|nr:hypothetical protein [Thermomicrobiales bacterium]